MTQPDREEHKIPVREQLIAWVAITDAAKTTLWVGLAVLVGRGIGVRWFEYVEPLMFGLLAILWWGTILIGPARWARAKWTHPAVDFLPAAAYILGIGGLLAS